MPYRFWDEANIQTSGTSDQDAGFFEWEVAEDVMRADSAVAELFGLSVREAEHGLPVLAYVNRIHVDDRKRVARAIHDSLVNCNTFREAYRIQRTDGSTADVRVSGRCFRNRDGDPAHFSGMISPAKPKPKHSTLRHGLVNHGTPVRFSGRIAANNA
jgi:PAS domain-containing protein